MRLVFLSPEFPPEATGGLGTHCYELVKQLGEQGLQVLLLIPKTSREVESHFRNVHVREVNTTLLNPYGGTYTATYGGYGGWIPVSRLNFLTREISVRTMNESLDIIHCHDWMTIPAGIRLKRSKGKPLVVTLHSTEYDRAVGTCPSREIIGMEKKGIEEADSVITVSRRMKDQLTARYDADEGKITVVYNGIDLSKFPGLTEKDGKKIVLFLGRMTNQKGPSFFLKAAAKVIRQEPSALFLVCGHGPNLPGLMREALELGIIDNTLFTGRVPQEELARTYEEASVYVMPSVSEPFGITALEAIASGTPVVLSRNAGVAEIIENCCKVDYWDIQGISDSIVSLLRDAKLAESIRCKAYEEIQDLGWNRVAQETMEVYRALQ